MDASSLNITPTPDVLIALTNTPLKPLDAICELIDNGIDAFRAADLAGVSVDHPWIQVHIPGEADVRRGEGTIRIADNGAGLDREGLERALTAGFSSKNQFDTLGLFGMGFNIASGKLGKRTVVTTSRKEDEFAIRTELDLPALVSNRSFNLAIDRVEKPADFTSGTIVEIAGWWEEGTQNHGFVHQLAKISKPKLAGELGRRYASILRRNGPKRIQMRVNNEPVLGFEHCVWSDSRFVERAGWGRIPAQIAFDEVLHTQRQCLADRSLIAEGADNCSQCNGSEFRTISERVHGWVGIQRYDDSDRFGVDVIRNGRAILVAEKEAFFSFAEEVGQRSREYPIDSQYGRIVGEIHLDHAPVDFTKQDFQRASESWERAMAFVRGKSLLEGKWEEGYKNDSPVGKLFKGYRKVRKPGREDLYMGRYDELQHKSVRISRETEREYLARFDRREDGFYDDENWWKLVEEAQTPPVRGLVPCGECEFQNQESDEECHDCGHILKGKVCINCAIEIRVSDVVCGDCGSSQLPEVSSPWGCAICETQNQIENDNCSTCDSLRGMDSPLSQSSLINHSQLRPELSFENRVFNLVKDKVSNAVSLTTYSVAPGSLKASWDRGVYPSVAFKSSSNVTVYVDSSHPIFSRMGASVQGLLATEMAQYLHTFHSDLAGTSGFSVANLSSSILTEVWGEQLSWTEEQMADEIRDLFLRISELLVDVDDAGEFFKELTPSEQTDLATKLISLGLFDKLEALSDSGKFLLYVKPETLARFYSDYSESWFGSVWLEVLPKFSGTANEAVDAARTRIIKGFKRALDDCAEYLSVPVDDRDTVVRVKASLAFLQNKVS